MVNFRVQVFNARPDKLSFVRVEPESIGEHQILKSWKYIIFRLSECRLRRLTAISTNFNDIGIDVHSGAK